MKMNGHQKIAELAQFCYDLSHQSYFQNHVFFEYSPKHNCVKIKVYVGGWEESADPVYNTWHSLDRYYDCVDVDDIKKSIMECLEKS